jgi:hypothetical protein
MVPITMMRLGGLNVANDGGGDDRNLLDFRPYDHDPVITTSHGLNIDHPDANVYDRNYDGAADDDGDDGIALPSVMLHMSLAHGGGSGAGGQNMMQQLCHDRAGALTTTTTTTTTTTAMTTATMTATTTATTTAMATATYHTSSMPGKRKRATKGSCKNLEERENQRMTHIAVERNRRRQMNEHLRVLRALMPPSYVQRVSA